MLWGEDAFLLRETALHDARRHQGDRGRRGGVGGWRATGPRHPLAVRRAPGAARHRLSEPVEDGARRARRPTFARPTPTHRWCSPARSPSVASRPRRSPRWSSPWASPSRSRSRARSSRRGSSSGPRASASSSRPRRRARSSRPSVRTSRQLAGALEQLGAAFEGRRITPAEVHQQFRGLGEQKTWDLCDRAFGKDLPGAIRALRVDRGERRRGVDGARRYRRAGSRPDPGAGAAGPDAAGAGREAGRAPVRLAGPPLPAASAQLHASTNWSRSTTGSPRPTAR